MGNNLLRKCAYCKNEDNVSDMVRDGSSYYHQNCWIEKKTKHSKPNLNLVDAYVRLDELKKETEIYVKNNIMGEYLILKLFSERYDITNFSKSFIQKIKQIKSGEWKFSFKKIDLDILYEIFLNENFKKSVRNMPKDKKLFGEEKLNYDLAVALNKYDSYIRHRKTKSEKELYVQEVIKKSKYIKENDILNLSQDKTDSKKLTDDDILF